MSIADVLTLLALALALTHFSFPLLYYLYLRSRWLNKPWDIKKDPSYRPRVTIIVPTYNEADLIESKLDNIFEQDYPKDLMSIIVVDSASTDGTLDIVERWRNKHPDARLVIIRENVRRGKAYALNNALKHVDGEIIVITDADSRWASKDVLSKTVSWLSDPNVGAVTCVKRPEKKGPLDIEAGYRDFYNIVRIGESKKWSTPIFHGELAAYKKDLLIEIGGFPLDIGADDSHSATLITLRKKRSVATEDVECIEIVPEKEYEMWRIRRAQHLVQHFIKTMRYIRSAPKRFRSILFIETWLHLINPWLLLVATSLLLYRASEGSLRASIILVIGLILLIYKPFRTWIATQIYLIVGMIKNIFSREIIWRKLVKNIRDNIY